MTQRLFVALWLALASTSLTAQTIAFDRYHTQEEIAQYMRDLATNHPELVSFHLLGQSAGLREIAYVVISNGDAESKPAMFMNGTHHGNEKSSTEGILGLMSYLVANRQTVDVSALLDTYAIYLLPLVNPDGHAASSRYDSRGRDPNRDYSYPDRPDSASYRIPEIRLIKDLADRVKFRAAAAYHSGMEGILWPWCHTPNRSDDYDLFYTLSKRSAQVMNMTFYSQSYNDYPTQGEFIDYVYWAHGTLGLTFEVSRAPTPSPRDLAAVVDRSIAGAMMFMYNVLALDRGQLEIERAGPPLPTFVAGNTPRRLE